MTFCARTVATVTVLTALVLCGPAQAQTPEIDALRVRAEQGDAEAQYLLGGMYDFGRGVPQDIVEALRWYRHAAEQGIVLAMVYLGSIYFDGVAVEKSEVVAHMWYDLAVSRGVSGERGAEASEIWGRSLETIADLMTPKQLAEAQRLAREWNAAHPR